MDRRQFLYASGATSLLASLGTPLMAAINQENGPIDLTSKGFSQSFIETTDGRMAVYEAGKGDPLLLLHGVGAGASSFIWYRIAPTLAEKYRVIAPDFIGWGASDRPQRNLLFDDYVAQIGTLARSVEGLDDEPIRIIASSLTSGFAIEAIDRGLITPSKLVLFSPSGGFDFGIDATPPEALDPFRRVLDTPQQEPFYARLFHQRSAVENWYRAIGFADSQAVPEELILSNVYNARQPNASYSAIPFLSGALRYDIAPLLQKVPDPALMVWGEGEFQIPPEARARIEQANPAIETARIEDARSVFKVEQPEATLAVLLPFLSG